MSDLDIVISDLPESRDAGSGEELPQSASEIDPDELYGGLVKYVRNAFDPPQQTEARKWWDYFPQFVETVERLQDDSDIGANEAEALLELYLSRMVEATVQEQFRGVLGGSLEGLEEKLWSEDPYHSGSSFSFWTHEVY